MSEPLPLETPGDTEALGVAGFLLSRALMTALALRGTLSVTEHNTIIDEALSMADGLASSMASTPIEAAIDILKAQYLRPPPAAGR